MMKTIDYIPNSLLNALANAIFEAGTIINLSELKEMALGKFGEWCEIVDDKGNILDCQRVMTRKGLQEIADIYTDGFDAIGY